MGVVRCVQSDTKQQVSSISKIYLSIKLIFGWVQACMFSPFIWVWSCTPGHAKSNSHYKIGNWIEPWCWFFACDMFWKRKVSKEYQERSTALFCFTKLAFNDKCKSEQRSFRQLSSFLANLLIFYFWTKLLNITRADTFHMTHFPRVNIFWW